MIESFSSLSPVPVFPLSCDARAGDLSCHDEAIEFSWSLCPAHASPPSCDARAGDLSCHDEAIEFSWSLSPALASPASSFSFFVPPTDDLSFHDESFEFFPLLSLALVPLAFVPSPPPPFCHSSDLLLPRHNLHPNSHRRLSSSLLLLPPPHHHPLDCPARAISVQFFHLQVLLFLSFFVPLSPPLPPPVVFVFLTARLFVTSSHETVSA